jgi:DNA (cytosine-5)-methyltransferase 1
MPIDYGSVCSGIEAATLAWHPLGMQAAWYAEIEPFPSAVLAHHYPNTPNHGDMTKLAGMVLAGKIAAPAVLVGGTPCQAFSVAGMRQGMLDPRGALTIKYVELADAIDHVRARRGDPEAVIVWENVPGVLSDKGNAFGCFLGALAGEDCELQPPGKRWQDAGCVYGPKRTIAWRILDAQYFGLAQRRRRVFLVASARDRFDPTAVLFEREGMRRDTAPRRGQGQEVAATLEARTEGGGFPGTNGATGGHVVAPPRWPLAYGGGRTGGPIEIAACLVAKGQKCDFEVESFVVHGTQDPCVSIDQAHTLGRNSGQENAVLAFSCKDHGADAGHLSPTLRAMNHSGSHANAGGQVAVCITGDIIHTLKAEGFDASEDGTGRGQPMVPGGAGVRRLTPVECERLQGDPDNYTRIPWRGRPAEQCPDGPRYKAIGNSKAVPVVRWLGLRILSQLEAA